MKFFKTFLASLLAVVVGFGLIVMIWAMIIAGIVASFGKSAPVVATGSVLRLNVGTVTDAPAESPLTGFDFRSLKKESRNTLLSVLNAIEAAQTDDRIEGIYINFDESTNVSISSLEEIRAALGKFKESGKFIVAYNEVYGQSGYFLASVADKVYMNPEGSMAWTGIAMHTMFYKGLLDKLDIQPIVIRHGSFKSAVEPFIYDRMSPENRLQLQTMANSIWKVVVDAVSASRGIAAGDLQSWANTLEIDSPGAALANGLIDGLRYEDEVMAELYEMVRNARSATVEEGSAGEGHSEMGEPAGESEVWVSSDFEDGFEAAVETPDEGSVSAAEPQESKRSEVREPAVVQFDDYVSHLALHHRKLAKNKIALIYAEGSIAQGEDSDGTIGSASLAARLSKVRRDPNVKAVVFRVNSPGGSALASEVIWREVELLRAEVPVIVSMGSYAASGGYYISCPADVIYANNTTLTGSIGVFGLFANIGKTLKNKLGITVDKVTTNTYSDVGSVFRDVSPAERAFFQTSVENVYTTFVNHVARGRNMTFEAVDEIGQGRVWTGYDALGIGLVDGIGGMRDAIAIAADRAGIGEDFRLWEVTDGPADFITLLTSLSASVRASVQRDEMGGAFVHFNNLRSMLSEQGVQARMPYIFEME